MAAVFFEQQHRCRLVGWLNRGRRCNRRCNLSTERTNVPARARFNTPSGFLQFHSLFLAGFFPPLITSRSSRREISTIPAIIRLSVVSSSPKSVVESLPSSPLSELPVESIGPIFSDWITFRLFTSSFAETPTHHEESLDNSGISLG